MRLKESHAWILAVIAVSALFVAQFWNLRLAAAPYTDEGVYAELGRLIFSGRVPNRDFFLAHMPLLPVAIGAGLKVFGSMYVLRVLYLFLNSIGVLLLFRFLVTTRKAPLAALVACLFFATYHEMVDHDFRFLAVRQLANLFLIGFLVNNVRRPKASTPVAVVLCCLGTFTFLPFLVDAGFIYAALAFSEPDRSKRLALARTYAAPLGVAALLVLLYFALVPGSFEQVVLFQRERPFMPYSVRLTWILQYSTNDLLFYGLGLVGLLLGGAFLERYRAFSIAMFGTLVVSIAAGAGFYPHYLVAAAPALAWGVFCAVTFAWERLAPRLVSAVFVAVAIVLSIHLGMVLPSLTREWASNSYPEFYQVIEAIRESGGPVLAFEPIYAVESGIPAVYHFNEDMRSLGIMDKSLTPGQIRELEAQACTILIEPFSASRIIPTETLDAWRAKYTTRFSSWWGTVLATRHPGCARRLGSPS